MQAVLVQSPNEWDVSEVPVPQYGPDDVLVKVKYAGICHTDLEVLKGGIDEPYIKYPIIPGHEWVGIVEKCGDSVKRFHPGDTVVVEGIIRCNHCYYCNTGRTNLCNNVKSIGYTHNGAFTEYVSAPQHVVHSLPSNVPLEIATLVEPTSVVLYALERANIGLAKTVAVVGPGPIGLLAVAMLKFYQPKEIILIGTKGDDERLAIGRRIGATRTVNINEEEPYEAVQKLTNGFGVDHVFECAGQEKAVELAFKIYARGGTVGIVGFMGGGQKVYLSTDDMMLKNLRLSATYASTTKAWVEAIRLLATGMVDVSPIITHTYQLREARKALESVIARKKGVIKVLLKM